MDKSKVGSHASLITSMIVFGTIGVFRRYVTLTSGLIAASRGIIGALFLILFLTLRRQKIDFCAVKKNALKLIISGVAMGFNWILLFEAYNYTTVAVATLCYYMAPIIIIIASPFLLKEKLTLKKSICVVSALCGMVLVSGVIGNEIKGTRGILLGLGAAVLYATVILINKTVKGVGAYDVTITQLLSAAIVVIPYSLIFEDYSTNTVDFKAIIFLFIIGIFYTGVTYAMYFGSISKIDTQSVAIISYIDPVVAIIVSVPLLNEPLTWLSAIGAVLILGSALIAEIEFKPKKQQKV